MKLWLKPILLLVLSGALLAAAPAFAVDPTQAADPRLSNAAPVATALAKDAVCTKCHDESETKPVLSIYKTRHGVKADGRTPSCQSCHGASAAHVKNTAGTATRPPVDVSFGAKDRAAPQQQADTCLTCHQGGQRTHWAGSQHAIDASVGNTIRRHRRVRYAPKYPHRRAAFTPSGRCIRREYRTRARCL